MPKLIAIVNGNDSNDNNSNDLSETLWSKRRPSLRQNAALFLFPPSNAPSSVYLPYNTTVCTSRPTSIQFRRAGARFTKYLTIIFQLSYDNAKVTIYLRRTVYKTSYEERKAFSAYNSLAKLQNHPKHCSQISLRYSYEKFWHILNHCRKSILR